MYSTIGTIYRPDRNCDDSTSVLLCIYCRYVLHDNSWLGVMFHCVSYNYCCLTTRSICWKCDILSVDCTALCLWIRWWLAISVLLLWQALYVIAVQCFIAITQLNSTVFIITLSNFLLIQVLWVQCGSCSGQYQAIVLLLHIREYPIQNANTLKQALQRLKCPILMNMYVN